MSRMEDVTHSLVHRRTHKQSSYEGQGSEDVSCRNLVWTFGLCERRNIDLSRVTRDVPYSVNHLKDASGFIDWQSYSTFVSNVGHYLSEEELLEAGRDSWKSGTLKIYSYIGRLLFNVKDQYLELFGPLGALAKLYPFEVSIVQLGPQKLRILLTMNPECIPCYAFHIVLAGQMIGLHESLGHPPAKVDVTHLENGASFDITYGGQRGLMSPLRKAVSWMFTARQTAKELTSTYESLLEKYRELQEEAQKLKLAELKVKESDERYRLIANNVNDIIWTMDTELKIQFVSPAVESITGYKEDETRSMRLQDVLTETSLTNAIEIINKLRRGSYEPKKLTTLEIELSHKEGHKVWLEIHANIIKDSNDITTVIGVARDITERKTMESEITEHENSYQVITNTAQDAIITIDKSNVITFANPASVKVFGYQISELIGKDATRLMPEALGSSQLREFFFARSTARHEAE
jgi:PAS domain S-box-containing protein